MADFLQTTEDGVVLSVRVTPKSRKSGAGEVIEVEGKAYLTFHLHSPPEKGKANKELFKTLAKVLGVARSGLELLAGETSRMKRILVRGKTTAEIVTCFEQHET
jgi:uncharacterized protein (TIGR00251 family)